MRISDILKQPLILPELHANDKEAALRALAGFLGDKAPDIHLPATQIFAALVSRERLGSTGVGEGVAIPHAKIPGLKQLLACFARVPEGVAFESIDHAPVRLIFVLLVPENSAGAHLKALARISRLLKNVEFRERLLTLATPELLFQAFAEEDEKH